MRIGFILLGLILSTSSFAQNVACLGEAQVQATVDSSYPVGTDICVVKLVKESALVTPNQNCETTLSIEGINQQGIAVRATNNVCSVKAGDEFKRIVKVTPLAIVPEGEFNQ